MKHLEKIKIQMIVLFLMQAIAVALLFFLGWSAQGVIALTFFVLSTCFIGWVVFTMEKHKQEQDVEITRVLGNEAKAAFDFGEIGIIVYDENYEITWISDFLTNQGVQLIGKKVTSFVSEIEDLLNGEVEVVNGTYNNTIYEIARKTDGSPILFVKDITEFSHISKNYEEEAQVIGVVHLDNYMDIAAIEDEAKVAMINTNLRQPIIEWAEKNGMMIRRLRSDRFLLVLNERIYQQLVDDKFGIINDTRKKAQEMEVSITLSMSFARGTSNIKELNIMANDLLELAQSRGGDQVAVKRYGGDVKYYGGNIEAVSKRSRVRVRVMAQALKEAILGSSQIFISGHKEMDFDAMGANLALSRIAQAYGKEVYIVSESGGIEPYLKNALETYYPLLSERHHFISDEEACRLKKKNDLMIVVDYHNPAHCNAPMLLEKSERIVVIDHHRRTENYIHKPLLVYIESGASSSCELITEFFPYLINDIDISVEEATIMYLGILVDTNRFKMRTGFRTFEAAAQLKKLGVDPIEAEDFLKEDFDAFEAKANIYRFGKLYRNNIIIADVSSGEVLSRTLMSMGADALLAIRDIEASFVIAKTAENEIGISARSRGNVNVQRIMEEMHGGGHFSAAAMQRTDTTMEAICEELKNTIDAYFGETKEDVKDESNLA